MFEIFQNKKLGRKETYISLASYTQKLQKETMKDNNMMDVTFPKKICFFKYYHVFVFTL